MPAEVYLIPDVNAFVLQRGGIMGVGSRRVMGIGLGILLVLNRSEFQSVLAHEFGHYYDGHLKRGPWIYQARMAMIRATESLGEWGSWLYGIYRAYVLYFLRVTQKISRMQEFVADEIAARLYGVPITIRTLCAVHAGSMVFDSYWEHEIAPYLRVGYQPRLLEGFARLVEHNAIADAVATVFQSRTRVVEHGETAAYDSHPSLAERIKALEALRGDGAGSGLADVDSTPAIALLDRPLELEGLLLQHVCGPRLGRRLKPITWEPLDGEMTLADYEELVRRHAPALKGLTPLSLLRLSGQIEHFGTRLMPAPDFLLDSDQDFVGDLTTAVFSAALMLGLRQAGWRVQLLSRNHALCTRGEEVFEPFQVVHLLRVGHANSAALRRQFMEAGIAAIDLGSVSPP
jgi:hypothetical protein